MRIIIYGAGAVGGYYGARLAQAGEEVGFVARGRQLAALRSGGLRVESIAGDVELERVAATDDPSSLGQADASLVTTKT
ncbi:MAG: 2-dehydropantoate 2-reductase, partial [Gammaproteobacteria bacterium]|nr:2-dehydropantoate 2-reductase [Gammaproteobacteria bacterium]